MKRASFARVCPALLLGGLLSGCAASPASSPFYMVKATKTQQVEADCALVTFLRPSIAAGAISFQAWDGERFVGELHGMNSVSYLATPGEHVFFAKAENWAVTKAQLAAGKRYYLVLRLRNADVRARSREG